MNSADRIYLTEIMAQLKIARDQKSEAAKELALWTDRMELARSKGARSLYDAAQERASRAQEVVRRAESTIMELEVEKSSFKGQTRVGDPAAVAQAQRMVQSLKGTDLDPAHAMLDRLSKESDADDALAALKAKMKQG